jgi:hypothetical protein
MKRLEIGVFCLVFVIFLMMGVYAFSAEEYQFPNPDFSCSDFGLECGIVTIYNLSDIGVCHRVSDDSITPNCRNCVDLTTGKEISDGTCSFTNGFTSRQKSCGTCTDSNFCYFGKCVNVTVLGGCTRTGNEDCTSFFFNPVYDFMYSTKQQQVDAHQTACIGQGCQSYDSTTRTCVGPLPACSFSNDSNEYFCEGAGCKFANNNLYVPKIVLIDKEGNILSPKETMLTYSASVVYLNYSDLNALEYGGRISLIAQLYNSNLPIGTPIQFEIFGLNNTLPTVVPDILIKTVNSAIAYIDGQGIAAEDISLSKEDLLKVDYYKTGSAYFMINVIVNGVHLVNPDQGDFVVRSTTGECSGISICSSYGEGQCRAYQELGGLNCEWNSQTNSCEGNGGVSCNNPTLQMRDRCNFFPDCHWRADSFWERLTDWVKSIFGA